VRGVARTPFDSAAIAVSPDPIPVTRPVESTVATAGFSLLHVAVAVAVLPLDIVAATVNISDWLIFKRSVEDVIASPVTVGVGPAGGGPSSPPPRDSSEDKHKGDDIPFHRDLHLSWIESFSAPLSEGARRPARVATAPTSNCAKQAGFGSTGSCRDPARRRISAPDAVLWLPLSAFKARMEKGYRRANPARPGAVAIASTYRGGLNLLRPGCSGGLPRVT
jgi:hypothetical protein